MKMVLLSIGLTAAVGNFPSQAHAQAAGQRYGAVVVYADPIEAGAPPGEAFAAPTEAQAIDLAVQSCRANTVTARWGNCAVGRWIATARSLMIANVCDAIDDNGDLHHILFFTKDGVTATDSQIREEAQRRVLHGRIVNDGCRKVAVYDHDKPARTEPEESLVVRSVARDKAR